jgi:hypothetical protein
MKRWQLTVLARDGDSNISMEKTIEADFAVVSETGAALFYRNVDQSDLVYAARHWFLIEQLPDATRTSPIPTEGASDK